MKRLTISLPDALADSLRERARSEGKTLNALILDLLSGQVQPDSSWSGGFVRLSNELSVEAPPWTWNREESYGQRLH